MSGDSGFGGTHSWRELINAHKVKTPKGKPGRKCECCDTLLAADNLGKLCWPCGTAIEGWRLFPSNRFENERAMAEHCLRYVAEKYAKRKKGGKTASVEVRSGDQTKAAGGKTLKGK